MKKLAFVFTLIVLVTAMAGVAFTAVNIFPDFSRKENIHGKRSRNARDNKALIYF